MTPLFDTITLSMIKRLTLCLLLTCLYVPCFSQERFVVRGRILDAESAPVPYCSVSILESRDSTILGGAVSDTEGRVTACISNRRAAICSVTTIWPTNPATER